MDKLNNKYFVGDYQYLSKLLNIDVDFETMQNLDINCKIFKISLRIFDERNKNAIRMAD